MNPRWLGFQSHLDLVAEPLEVALPSGTQIEAVFVRLPGSTWR